MTQKPEHITIVGGGVIGLSVGWQLLRNDISVSLFERDEIGSHASYAAAGMLAPYAEVGFEEVELMKLGQRSLQLYPKFLLQLAEDADEVPTLDRCGTLMAGIDRDDTEHLRRLYNFREELALPVELMTGTAAREREPHLSPKVVSALWFPKDAQIDNRMLLKALKEAFQQQGGNLYEHAEVEEMQCRDGSLYIGCQGLESLQADAVVVAAGSWTGKISGMPDRYSSLIRPVKGQILTLRKTQDCNIGCMIRSPRTYLVPKENGTIRLGATSEDKGYETDITAGGLKYLLEYGWEIVPSIYDLPVEESLAGLRPAAKDNLPIIGETDVPDVYIAGGHYRHGILLTPVTAFGMAEILTKGSTPEWFENFSPQRFLS